MKNISKKLYANITVNGLENIKDIDASTIKIETTCTNKTKLTLKFLES